MKGAFNVIIRIILWMTFVWLLIKAFEWYIGLSKNNKVWFWLIMVMLALIGGLVNEGLYGTHNYKY